MKSRKSANHVAVLGAGSWGTTLANHPAGRGLAVRLWAFEAEVVAPTVHFPGEIGVLHKGLQILLANRDSRENIA